MRDRLPSRRSRVFERSEPSILTTTGRILELQRTAGNRATTRLLDGDARTAMVQRFAPGSHGIERTLRWGSRGADVEVLQDYLVQAGARLAVDGIFGPITHRAAVGFQRAAGLSPDGIVGTLTWGALKTGGVTIDVGAGTGVEGSELAERVAARLQSIAARLSPLSDGVQANAFNAFGQDASAEGPVAGAAHEVLQLIGQPAVQDTLGPITDDLGAVAGDLVSGNIGGDLQGTLVQLDTIATDVGEAVANQAGKQTDSGSSTVEVVSDTTYKIGADDIAGVGQSLSEHMAVHGEAAHVAPHGKDGGVTLDTEMSADGRVVKATIKLELERVLPEWTKADSTNCSCWKAEWDRFDTAIRGHEQEHVNIFKKFLTGLHLKMIGKTEDAANKVFDEAFDRSEAAQSTFDTTTSHGQVPPPGTTFNAGKPCTC
jgi:predicted secreted Zn-dependent protease